jgi:hypothetical protein
MIGGFTMVEQERSCYLDNIRLLVIVLVVIMHVAVTYSGIGSWYFKDVGRLSMVEKLPFLFYQSFTQSYFMGLLFLLAGYMVPRSLDKKGSGVFLRDRLIRLGGPTLFYMLVIHPFIVYGLLGKIQQPFWDYYLSYIGSLRFIGGSGPLWFAFALLMFSAIYAAVNVLWDLKNKDRKIPYEMKDLWRIGLLVAVCSFLVRIVQPIDSSILNMHLPFFSPYIVFFIVGTMAARERLLDHIDYRLGIRCLQLSLFPGVILWILMLFSIFSAGSVDVAKGGLYWQSFLYALWESLNAVFVSFGLIATGKAWFNRQNTFIRNMSDASFAVYVFHAPILVAISKLIQPWYTSPMMKY